MGDKMKIPGFLKTRAAWVLIAALAGAVGIKLTSEQQQAIQIMGPELATEIENAANDDR